MSQVPQAPPASGPPYLIPLRPTPNIQGAPVVDQALQTVYGPLVNATQGIQFDGVDDTICGCAPSDANMTVGPNHLLQTVNDGWAVYDKNGNIFPGFPKTLGSIWTNLGAPCNQNWGDVVSQYDRVADRWLITQLGSFNAPFFECVAVSKTNDPTGAYSLYSYNIISSNDLPDYPKWGVWPTASNPAYLANYNLFANGQNEIGAAVCAYDRSAMLAGNPTATQICFQISDLNMQPSDLDGSAIPPAGSPGFFLDFPNTSSLHLYQLTPNFANPSGSTLTGPVTLSVTSFNEACGGRVCVPQSGTSTQLDALGDRLMYRFAYRNFGSYESAVVGHGVTAGSSVGMRWYEIRGLNTSPSVFQQGTFSPDATFRWMGSVAQDKAGDIAMGYSTSSTSLHPGIAFTGRIPSDSLGTMESEQTIFTGGGSQTGGLTRWGDYTALRVDPADDCTFWYTNQYIPANGSFNWKTRIASFVFPNCTGQPVPDFTISATPPSQSIKRGQTAAYTVTIAAQNGFNGTVTLSATGNPKKSTVTFSPATVTGSGTSTMSVKTFKFLTKITTSTITITGTSGSLSHSATVQLTTTKLPDDNAPDDPGGN